MSIVTYRSILSMLFAFFKIVCWPCISTTQSVSVISNSINKVIYYKYLFYIWRKCTRIRDSLLLEYEAGFRIQYPETIQLRMVWATFCLILYSFINNIFSYIFFYSSPWFLVSFVTWYSRNKHNDSFIKFYICDVFIRRYVRAALRFFWGAQ